MTSHKSIHVKFTQNIKLKMFSSPFNIFDANFYTLITKNLIQSATPELQVLKWLNFSKLFKLIKSLFCFEKSEPSLVESTVPSLIFVHFKNRQTIIYIIKQE